MCPLFIISYCQAMECSCRLQGSCCMRIKNRESGNETPPRRFDSLNRPYSPQGDRILGHEWAEWDGDIENHDGEIAEPPSLFLLLAGVCALFYAGIAWCVWYMAVPRLAQWNPTVPEIMWWAWAGVSIIWFFWYALMAASALHSRQYLPLSLSRIFVSLVNRAAFLIGRIVGKNRDHVGNSFIEVWNALQRGALRNRSIDPTSLLVLLPRCLEPSLFGDIKKMCQQYGCSVSTVGRGRQARDKIRELCPGGIIGVACERDLITGINDVKASYSILGLNIKRIAGPCKHAMVDLDALRASIETYLKSGELPDTT
jgi:uncharacterized protein